MQYNYSHTFLNLNSAILIYGVKFEDSFIDRTKFTLVYFDYIFMNDLFSKFLV